MNCPICKVETDKPMKHMLDHMTGKAKKDTIVDDHSSHEHLSCPMCSVQLHTEKEMMQHAKTVHSSEASR